VPFTDCKSLLGWQQGFPSILNIAVVDVVSTTVEYLVRVRTLVALTGLQHLFTSAYCSVPSPIVKTTGAEIVVVVGID